VQRAQRRDPGTVSQIPLVGYQRRRPTGRGQTLRANCSAIRLSSPVPGIGDSANLSMVDRWPGPRRQRLADAGAPLGSISLVLRCCPPKVKKFATAGRGHRLRSAGRGTGAARASRKGESDGVD
jgi:hypothetical protein